MSIHLCFQLLHLLFQLGQLLLERFFLVLGALGLLIRLVEDHSFVPVSAPAIRINQDKTQYALALI